MITFENISHILTKLFSATGLCEHDSAVLSAKEKPKKLQNSNYIESILVQDYEKFVLPTEKIDLNRQKLFGDRRILNVPSVRSPT